MVIAQIKMFVDSKVPWRIRMTICQSLPDILRRIFSFSGDSAPLELIDGLLHHFTSDHTKEDEVRVAAVNAFSQIMHSGFKWANIGQFKKVFELAAVFLNDENALVRIGA